MDVPSILAIIGGIALLVGLFGGGVEAKEIKIPEIPGWSRIISGIIGFAFIGLAIGLSFFKPGEVTDTPELTSTALPAYTFTSLPTIKPTNTPRLEIIPTATIDSDPTVYDNFNNPANDGSFNQEQWYALVKPPSQVSQQAGILTLTDKGVEESIRLMARKYASFRLTQPTFLQADLLLSSETDTDVQGAINFGIQTDGWFSSCLIQYDPNDQGAKTNGNCWDTLWPGQEGHYFITDWLAVEKDSWHTFRIEIDPGTMTFRYFFDGTNIGEHVSVDADKLKKAIFEIGIAIHNPKNGTVIGRVDNFRIGPLK